MLLKKKVNSPIPEEIKQIEVKKSNDNKPAIGKKVVSSPNAEKQKELEEVKENKANINFANPEIQNGTTKTAIIRLKKR